MQKPTLYRVTLTCVGLFFAFLIAAIFSYRGGNPTDIFAHYNLGNNFISDLGAVETYSLIPQYFTIFLLNCALVSASLALMFFISSQSRIIAVRITGFTASLSILAIGLLPSDIFFWPHRIALFFTVFFLTISFGLMSKQGSWLIRIGFLFGIAYILFIVFGPHPEVSAHARYIQVILQKVFIGSEFLLIAIETRRRQVS
jgi:hypothetical protein